VQSQMPWVRGAIVKDSIGTFSANSMVPEAARRLIRREAETAVANAASAKPYVFESPITLEVDLAKAEQADLVEMIPGFQRSGGRSVRFVHDEFPTIFKAFVATWRLGAQA